MTFSLQYTLNFIHDSIPVRNTKILEAGCGEGDIAYHLQAKGAVITAVDIDAEVVPLAIEKGVRVLNMDFLSVKGEFDIILFTRSLHHMTDVNTAMQHATCLLKKKGVIILEEFDYTNMDVITAEWFYKSLAQLKKDNLLKTEINIPDNPIEQWKESHDHDPALFSGSDMAKAVKLNFSRVKVTRGPYLFRYMEDLVIQNQDTEKLIEQIYQNEKELIEIGKILPLGIRVVAFKK
jgi:ubiquinone/menaquinone biosynthesis C-methylase UbiE